MVGCSYRYQYSGVGYCPGWNRHLRSARLVAVFAAAVADTDAIRAASLDVGAAAAAATKGAKLFHCTSRCLVAVRSLLSRHLVAVQLVCELQMLHPRFVCCVGRQ